MEELRKALANSSIEHKVSLLPQALEYGKQGIEFLIECLQDSELEIRATAYELLKDINSELVRNAIALVVEGANRVTII